MAEIPASTAPEAKSPKVTDGATTAVLPDALFVLVPLLVLAIVFVATGRGFKAIFASPEWSFGAAVLFGQALVKLVSAISVRGGVRHNVTFLVALLIVFGVVPSMVVLSLVLLAEPPSLGLVWAQTIMFFVALAVFIILGTVAEDIAGAPRR